MIGPENMKISFFDLFEKKTEFQYRVGATW